MTAPTLPPAVDGERREIDRRAGRLSYYVDGDGPPLLLVHSVNAAASVYEVKPIYERLRRERRVYAPDLPGYGFSDRSDRAYTMPLFVDAVRDMLDEIAAGSGGGPVDVLALSLASEFVARVAVDQPGSVRSLALVTPTGFSRLSDSMRGAPGSTREVPGLHAFFNFPVWSKGFYNLLTSRPSIRFFLKKTFGSDRIDQGLLDYDCLTTRQPGARHAPYAFVSGKLFSTDIRNVYERIVQPVWVPHATRGDFQDFSGAGWARARANWHFQPWEAGALPQFEYPDDFADAYRRFLATAPGLAAA